MKNNETKSEAVNEFALFLSTESESLFDGLNSVYKRKQFYTEYFGFINPVKVILKKTFTAEEGSSNLAETETFGYYVPFQRSLEKLLSLIPSTEKLKYSENIGPIKTNIFDGNIIKNMLTSKTKKNQLLFAIYCYEREIVNPIGAHRTKHKISKFLNHYKRILSLYCISKHFLFKLFFIGYY